MSTTAEQLRTYHGPALLSYGFRPFFLGGALWSVLAVALWLPMLAGRVSVPTAFTPLEWHIHELLYGYVPAVAAGFLLTAVPNWTGRLPVVGARLLALVAIWLAGRAAVLVSLKIGAMTAAIIDLAFLVALALLIGREIVAGRNWRNLKVLAAIAVLLVGNAVFHLEAIYLARGAYGVRIGIAAAVMLITLIGGRIVPSFTRNWLAKRGPGTLPAAFDRLDAAAMAISGAALALWVAQPEGRAAGLLSAAAAALNGWRLARWQGGRTLGEPLVLVLHVAFGFVPLGFGLLALSILAPGVLLAAGAMHAWTAGAIGMMTLAVMTRASLGHTGRPLTARPTVQLVYLMAFLAAISRIGAGLGIARDELLVVSAGSWIAAFGGFVAIYGPILLERRST